MTMGQRTFLIWLFTNLFGSILAQLTLYFFEDEKTPGMIFIMLYIVGSIFSLPAVIFTRFNLQFIKNMKASPNEKYFYTFFSTLLFIVLCIYAFIYFIAGKPNDPDYLHKVFKLLGAHTFIAVFSTMYFVRGMIKNFKKLK